MARTAVMTYDDLLTRLDASLRGNSGPATAARLRARYDVGVGDDEPSGGDEPVRRGRRKAELIRTSLCREPSLDDGECALRLRRARRLGQREVHPHPVVATRVHEGRGPPQAVLVGSQLERRLALHLVLAAPLLRRPVDMVGPHVDGGDGGAGAHRTGLDHPHRDGDRRVAQHVPPRR